MKCDPLDLFEGQEAKAHLMEGAYSDLQYKECMDRHNGLVEEIVIKQRTVNEIE